MTEKIPDIYIYCDRWCERCAYASRCEAFHVDESVKRDQPLSYYDAENKAFWTSLEAHYTDAVTYIRQQAETFGENLDAFEGMRVRSGYNLFHGKVMKSELLSSGRIYEDLVDDWLDQQSDAGLIGMQEMRPGAVFQIVSDMLPGDQVGRVNSWLEVIMRYQLQVFLKLSRSFYILSKEEQGTAKEEELPASDGSAKTAREMLIRSLVSWSLIKDYFPDALEGTQKILLHLYRMIRKLEAEFPKASEFKRTGFDQ